MELDTYREKIDQVDKQMVALLVQRMTIAEEISAWKGKNGMPVHDPARERRKLSAIGSMAPEGAALPLQQLYALLMCLTRAHERTASPQQPLQASDGTAMGAPLPKTLSITLPAASGELSRLFTLLDVTGFPVGHASIAAEDGSSQLRVTLSAPATYAEWASLARTLAQAGATVSQRDELLEVIL